MVIDLENMAGYKRGISIRGAPYDFRFIFQKNPGANLHEQIMGLRHSDSVENACIL